MTHNAVLTVSPAEREDITEYLENSGLMSEDETIVYTVRFQDGYEMDIKVCGAGDEPAWTEAVLYDPNGYEVAYTEPSDELDCIWTLEDTDSNVYNVTVV